MSAPSGSPVVCGDTIPGDDTVNLVTSTIVGTVIIAFSSSPGVVVTWSFSAASGSS